MQFNTCIKCGRFAEDVKEIQFMLAGKSKRHMRTMCPKCIEDLKDSGIKVEVI